MGIKYPHNENMKAELSQIPVNERRTGSLTHTGSKSVDTLWAQLRRLKAQVDSLELAASTARRDINRIDKKQYREADKTPPSSVPQQELSPALFG
ncbi:unnamed protein product [marine sediment metagenome]|uniref:Uncharacterized protein n=1 Tax=marine sediment metagenome TaxID=412755 RepID=X1KDZ0_9ZZZZ